MFDFVAKVLIMIKFHNAFECQAYENMKHNQVGQDIVK